MTKLTYTNDQQIINDAAQMLIEAHLRWSGSNEGMPSKDIDFIGGQIGRAWLEANYTPDEWNDLDDSKQRLVEEMEIRPLYKKAKQLADRKWEAAMTLLGIEQ